MTENVILSLIWAPALASPPVKMPEKKVPKLRMAIGHHEQVKGWNDCIDEIKRLNDSRKDGE